MGSLLTSDDDKIFMASRHGKSIQFFAKAVKTRKRMAGGMRGMRLSGGDRLVSLEVINDNGAIMSVTVNGYGKRTELSEYREQSKGGSGVKLANITAKTGDIVGAMQVQPNDDVMLVTKSGKAIRFAVRNISVVGRATQGVRLMDTGGDEIISIAVIRDNDDEQQD
ncbi:hypothetical protein RsTz2092_10320 [Deferribacterales bacterium RsTz2092]